MIILEIAKYFVNYVLFYIFLALQIVSFVTIIILLCKGTKAKHKGILSVLFACSLIYIVTPTIIGFVATTNQDYDYVVHAGGGIDDKIYLNSEEGFLTYAEQGCALMEIDFLYTSDGEIVASHYFEYFDGYDLKNRPTIEVFKNTKLDGKYTGMTFEWLVQQLKNYENIRIIFDSKENDTFKLLEDMVTIANENGLDLSSRMIIQVYSIENYNEIKNNPNFNFETFWFTNYKANYSNIQIEDYFNDKKDVETIVMSCQCWWVYHQTGYEFDKKIAVHTVNGDFAINFLADRGVDLIYVDFM